MSRFTQVGEFCPNPACSDYGKLQSEQRKPNLKKNGKTRRGRQRYLCQTCGQTFTETKTTIFYRRRTPEPEILECLAFLAEGVRVSTLARVKGHNEDTLLAWLRAAAQHAETIEERLMADYQLERGQLDALWSYVGHKGEKKAMRKANPGASSGAPR
jgi:transposase-like protein